MVPRTSKTYLRRTGTVASTAALKTEGLPEALRGGYFAVMSKHSAAIEEAIRAGFDMSLIDANLSYSYERRVLLHDAALELALEFERAGRELRGKAQQTPPAPLRR